jgi:hypothetical protein
VASAEFYLYFRSERSTREAVAQLKRDAFSVTVLPGAVAQDWDANDETSWLVLGSRAIADGDELERVDAALAQLASDLAGEYEGHAR